MKSKFYIFAAIVITMTAFLGCNRPETYTVTFNPNGGTGTMQPQTFTEGEAQALTRNAFTYDGYTFTGWNTVQGGSGISYPDGQTITATMDMTLYAQWTSNGSSGGGQQGGGENPVPPVPEGCPTVETSFVTPDLSPILNGEVTAAGNAPISSRGFMYGTSANNFSNSVECGSGTGVFSKIISDLTPSTTYYFKAYAINSIGTAYGEVMSFNTPDENNLVDLGLPSGTKWATRNVGANGPTSYGTYFTEVSKISTTRPTKFDMEELKSNCTAMWVTTNGVNGCLFTGPNGNSIFLPAAGAKNNHNEIVSDGICGYYLSSTFESDGGQYGDRYQYGLYFNSDDCVIKRLCVRVYVYGYGKIYTSYPVRGVHHPSQN